MNRDALQISEKIRNFQGNMDEAFFILQALGKLVGEFGMKDSDVVEAAILLKSKEAAFHDCQSVFSDVIDDIMRNAGLYPYISAVEGTFRDSLFYEMNSHPSDENFVFHNIQSKIFWDLVSGKNLVVSAPTSFGKSAVIDPLILHKKLQNVLLIVPTVSLLDETRKRMERTFGGTYQIISHKRDLVRVGIPTIFVMTQERAIERDDIELLDLLVVDEFYKLDPNKESGGSRYRTLNRALYKYGKMANQVYLLGPNINFNRTELIGKSFKIYETDFQTVAVEIFEEFGLSKDGKVERTAEILTQRKDESTLVFVSSPAQANKLAAKLIEEKISESSGVAKEWGEELSQNVHQDWVAAEALRHGIGMHHGRLPRSISQLNVSLFNEKKLNILICTSSLIEGVNTVAENIIILHNKISTTKHDFFTYSNIKGRAGRMLQHYVGRVFLFDEAPEPISIEVEIPIADEKSREEEGFLFDVYGEDLSPNQLLTVTNFCETFEVSEGCISKLMDYGIRTKDDIDLFRSNLELYLADSVGASWDFPKYPQLKLAYEFIWDHMNFGRKGSRSGVRTASQATLLTFRLYGSDNINKFLSEYIEGVPKFHATNGDAIEAGFQFLRAAEFTLPSAIMDLSYFIQSLAKRADIDYSAYAVALENWFKKSTVQALEEFGIPYFISEKYEKNLVDDNEILWNMKVILEKMDEDGYFKQANFSFLRESFPSRYLS